MATLRNLAFGLYQLQRERRTFQQRRRPLGAGQWVRALGGRYQEKPQLLLCPDASSRRANGAGSGTRV
jgi:hypothetical protein